MNGKTEKKKAKTRNRDAFKKPQAGRKVMAQLLLKFVLAGFFFFFFSTEWAEFGTRRL